MKIVPTIRNLILISVLSLTYSSLSAQKVDFLEAFPDYFDYELRVDSIAQLEHKQSKNRIIYTEKTIHIGCQPGLEVKPLFSLSLSQETIYETIPSHFEKAEGSTHIQGFQFILYAWPKANPFQDSLVRLALNEYCIYGQHNYLKETSKYFIFSYHFAMNGGGHVKYLYDMGLWLDFEQALEKALDKGAPQHNEFYPAHSLKPSDHYSLKKLAGDFIWVHRDSLDLNQHNLGRPFRPNEEAAVRKLEINSRGKGRMIANYNQNRSHWYKDKIKVHLDHDMLFIDVEGWGLSAYRIYNENCLIDIKYGNFYIRKE